MKQKTMTLKPENTRLVLEKAEFYKNNIIYLEFHDGSKILLDLNKKTYFYDREVVL